MFPILTVLIDKRVRISLNVDPFIIVRGLVGQKINQVL